MDLQYCQVDFTSTNTYVLDNLSFVLNQLAFVLQQICITHYFFNS